ncbi:MarR family transcriptional regulator [Natronolimnobius baerhuensis]|uniref:ArsR family transcriptional regulator n=1 Tax=Natronolimnobius baerhuensis TaxID=253108 RepID=A0A202E3M9_9EURY|nr:helix-turn-helix domain-containing protein [Natronolimnobius baerhuensis]OVE82895.1 ArsR family transcriptional regulator [Natronolimnobius baerhuensis]
MSSAESQHRKPTQNGSWDDIHDLPPSAKLVAKVLEYSGTMAQKQIADETLLPARTVRYALNRLDEKDVVDS